MNGHSKVCFLLLGYGANVNQVGIDGGYPLYIASQNGYSHLGTLLLGIGAYLNHANNNDNVAN